MQRAHTHTLIDSRTPILICVSAKRPSLRWHMNWMDKRACNRVRFVVRAATQSAPPPDSALNTDTYCPPRSCVLTFSTFSLLSLPLHLASAVAYKFPFVANGGQRVNLIKIKTNSSHVCALPNIAYILLLGEAITLMQPHIDCGIRIQMYICMYVCVWVHATLYGGLVHVVGAENILVWLLSILQPSALQLHTFIYLWIYRVLKRDWSTIHWQR